MSNKTIYGANPSSNSEKYHYVYRITNLVEQKHYYGVRSSSRHPLEDLGTHYFSSSTLKHFIQDQKKNPQNYKYKVVRVCNSRLDANNLEILLHKTFNVNLNESFYNLVRSASSGFSTEGQVQAFCCNTGKYVGLVPLNDERIRSGEVVGSCKGMCAAFYANTKEFFKMLNVNDPLWGTGEYIKLNTGKADAYCSKSGTFIGKIDVSDLRWVTGEVVGINFRKSLAYCSKTGANLGQVSCNDPRWITGEIVGYFKNIVKAYSPITGEYVGMISRNDLRWTSGEVVGYSHPFIQISNGIHELVYTPDGTQTIEDGWVIVKARLGTKVKLVNVYSKETGELLYSNVVAKLFANRFGYNQARVSECARNNMNSGEMPHSYRDIVVKYSDIEIPASA